ncbi:MAG: hypothetical protein HC869_00965 [Rhodospirillales bacterium]|nr:hypothetical protein [Rhodospirillales bacterium]
MAACLLVTSNVRELLNRLGEAYPGLKPQLARGVSVAIVGVIFRDGWQEPPRQSSVLAAADGGG